MLSLWKNRPALNFWEESGQFEGDIMLEGPERTGVINSIDRWPDGVIPYYIDDEHFSKYLLGTIFHLRGTTALIQRLEENRVVKVKTQRPN